MKHLHQLLHWRALACLFVIFMLVCVKAKAQDHVTEFTADEWTGCGFLQVQFTNRSAPLAGATASWDFGDGTASSLLHPAKVFNKPGTYPVKLVMTFSDGSTGTVTHDVIVYRAPEVKINASALEGCTPLKVDFTDQSAPGDGTITRVQWDFGEGNGAEGTTATHTYELGDNIKVTSIVTNSVGCTSAGEQLIKVKASPKVAFSADPRGACKPPFTLNLVNNTTLNTNLPVTMEYSWNFGDGATSTETNPSHEYTTPGKYTVALTAKTSEGCEQTLTETDYVVISQMQADFTVAEKPCRGVDLHFTNTSQPAPQSATWTFSDGTTLTGVDVVKRFNTTGSYTVTMTATTADGCSASTSKTIVVTDPPTVDFSSAPAVACKVPADIQFNAQTSGATSWQWSFDDGQTSTDQHPLHQFTAEKSYNVKLVGTNADGCADSVTKPIVVQKPKLSINMPATGCLPLTVTPEAVVTAGEPVTKYSWDFGDGTTSTDAKPSHTYTQQSDFTITLQIETQSGCTQSATASLKTGNPVKVDFSVDKTQGCQEDRFTFTNRSVPPGDQWSWRFTLPDGGAVSSDEQNPVIVFPRAGTYTASLTVISQGCSQTLTKPNLIVINPPVADFNVEAASCANVYERRFTDKSDFGGSADRQWHWDFGDGSTSAEQSPLHTYAKGGTYVVTLTVTSGGCTSVKTGEVSVIDEKPVIHASADVTCNTAPLSFNMDPVQFKNFSAFRWVWGDGTTGNTDGQQPTEKTYKTPGIYTVKLEATDIYGCVHTSNELTITVNGATPDFAFSVKKCRNIPMYFTDKSTTRAGNRIVSWTINLDDGSAPKTFTTPGFYFEHTYTVIKDYYVRLTTVDEHGCSNTITKLVRLDNVVAKFGATSRIACLNKEFQFDNLSETDPLQYTWNFGDGTTSNEPSPKHVYTTPGTYTVKLDVRNNSGCTDSYEVTDFLRVPNPVARFSYPPVAADVCPPIKVQFTNESTDYVKSAWSFGDGSTSSEKDPLHNYIRPGTFDVTLVAISEGGCESAPYHANPPVKIAGPDGTFTVSPETGCAPLTTTMRANSSTAIKYTWDFGDGYTVTTTAPVSPAYTYGKEGIYFPAVLLEDDRGCKVPALGNPRVVADKVTANFSADVSKACDGGIVTFTDKSSSVSEALGPMTYAWDFGIPGRTDDVATGPNPSFNFEDVDTYNVTLTTTSYYGCKSTVTLPVTIEESPAAEILPVMPICAGQSVQLKGRDNRNLPGTKWLWKVDPDKEYNVVDPPRIQFDQAGMPNVKLVITNASGLCSSEDNKQVEVSALPVLDPGPKNASICRGASIQVQANATPGVQLTWTDYRISDIHSATPTVSPETDTVYHVVAENAIGCISEADLPIAVSQPFTVSVSDAEICLGKNVQLQASGAVSYKWTPAAGLSNPEVANPVASPTVTTRYTVTGFGKDDCFTDTKEATVTVHPLPEINAGPDMEVSVGDAVTLPVKGSQDITRLEWWPPNWLSCVDCLTPVASPKQSVTYRVTAANQFGCVSTDDINIKMICHSGSTFLPNSFSPNGDGQNDVFYIRGRGVKTVKSFRIFNRWGQQVFDRYNFNIEDPSYGWDGKIKGVAASADVYVYVAEVVCDTDETFILKGDVMLLR